MRYVVSGRLRQPSPLSPAEYITVAIREWEIVLGWLSCGKALAYGRVGAPVGGAILLDVASEAEARALAESLPFAPYAEVSLRRTDGGALVGPDGLLGWATQLGDATEPAAI